ncbi:hypothetical protein, partial [Schnuerera sp.]|uniref:hypothetical protein n=1 Tax=Schnuerera sp. TaxID=2794844 RepID=UPI002CD7864C
GEYEITDAIRWLLDNGYNIDYQVLKENWRDIGTPIDVIRENIGRLSIIENNIIGEVVNSHVSGKIILGKGSAIYNSLVRGPIIVGENTIIKYSYIGPYTSIGDKVNIEKSNLENSIIFDGCTIRGVGNSIENSIIGEGSIIGKEEGIKKFNKLILGRGSRIYLSS